MKVGYVLKRYPRLSETFIVNEILGLEAAGVEAAIYALGFPAEARFHPTIGQVQAPVTYLATGGREAIGETFELLRRTSYRSALPTVMEFLDDINPRYRPDLIVAGLQLARAAQAAGIEHLHAHFMTVAAHTAYVAHLFGGIPFSVTAHAKDIFRRGVDRRVFSTVASAAQAIITVSEYNVRFIHDHLVGPDQARVVRVYNGLDVEALQPDPRARERNLLLAVGRLVEKKGFDRLIRVLADLPQAVRLVVIGEGEQQPALRGLATELGLNDRVRFLGAQSSDVVAEWMARAWVLAAPFVVGADGNQDALPTVLVEALSRGLPVVAADVGGVPEIIDHEVTGLVVPTGDDRSLSEALTRLLEDGDLHARLCAAGPSRALSRFDRSVTIPQWLEAVTGRRMQAMAS